MDVGRDQMSKPVDRQIRSEVRYPKGSPVAKTEDFKIKCDAESSDVESDCSDLGDDSSFDDDESVGEYFEWRCSWYD